MQPRHKADASSSLQIPECLMPVTCPAKPGWDTAWTVASNAKLSLSKTPRLAASNAAENAPRIKHCIADVSGRVSSPMTNTPTPLRQAISAQDRFTEADAPSMTDANGTSYRTPGSSSVDDDGDDDFEPPRDSSNSSDTLQDLLNEIDEEREDADVENVQMDLQDPNTDRTPRVRRTESCSERVALERSRSPRHSDREKTQLHE
ncbi:uncharacterized protein PITG_07750 [Phytophthora infestans T30-4]|uniref:Uncharacterized protein n=1 Tax=Phytophthora infestans (strain T30-4) TaxID=403677 RepID=D0N912_PHYIT|nr:uncharacterized protein PITG_07750 [Phytophthora infestans T30-4]EEY54047.1 conserved hypothetical protein [Phytophthora infestans T30-4]|eukprot:XP_002904678.1 conserved hypothetical protein [Phytophthora infestans T30-4]